MIGKNINVSFPFHELHLIKDLDSCPFQLCEPFRLDQEEDQGGYGQTECSAIGT